MPEAGVHIPSRVVLTPVNGQRLGDSAAKVAPPSPGASGYLFVPGISEFSGPVRGGSRAIIPSICRRLRMEDKSRGLDAHGDVWLKPSV